MSNRRYFDCPECDGEGEIEDDELDYEYKCCGAVSSHGECCGMMSYTTKPIFHECKKCKGTGQIPNENWEPDEDTILNFDRESLNDRNERLYNEKYGR